MISINKLNKSFNKINILKDISLDIESGKTLTIIGPSGSGKSTLLRCINLLETPEKGEVIIDDVSYNANDLHKNKYLEIRKASAMVFQNYNLFNNKTVIDNIITPLTVVKKINKEKAHKIAINYLEKVGLLDKQNDYPAQLSGGQKQRVAIARALSLNPKVILFDEPTSALDPELVQEVLNVIKEVSKEKVTMIIVTHEMEFAHQISDEVIFMEEGMIIEKGSATQIFEYPKEQRTRQFLARYRKDIEYMI